MVSKYKDISIGFGLVLRQKNCTFDFDLFLKILLSSFCTMSLPKSSKLGTCMEILASVQLMYLDKEWVLHKFRSVIPRLRFGKNKINRSNIFYLNYLLWCYFGLKEVKDFSLALPEVIESVHQWRDYSNQDERNENI